MIWQILYWRDNVDWFISADASHPVHIPTSGAVQRRRHLSLLAAEGGRTDGKEQSRRATPTGNPRGQRVYGSFAHHRLQVSSHACVHAMHACMQSLRFMQSTSVGLGGKSRASLRAGRWMGNVWGGNSPSRFSAPAYGRASGGPSDAACNQSCNQIMQSIRACVGWQATS